MKESRGKRRIDDRLVTKKQKKKGVKGNEAELYKTDADRTEVRVRRGRV